MTNLDYEILEALESITGLELSRYALEELNEYYPETDFRNIDSFADARRKYMTIVKAYLIFYRIPLTIESICSAFLWGTGNLKNKGLENTPAQFKAIIAKVRHYLEPQAEALMIEAEKK